MTLVALSTLVLACRDDRTSGSSTGISTYDASEDPSTGDTIETSTSEASTTSTTTTGGTDGTEDPSSPDVSSTEPVPDFASTTPDGCRGKIDLMFVIGKDGTMWDQQPAVTAGLPGFLAHIKDTFADFDLHVLVLDGHGGLWGMSVCEELCVENAGQGCEPTGPADYPCYAYSGGVLDECDWIAGAGDTFPAGEGAANKRCEIEGDRRYITSDDVNFDEAFLCLTQVGYKPNSQGDKVPGMLQFAFDPEWGAPCNQGFLRDDALLVATLITDDVLAGGFGTPEEWTDALVTAKHGDLDAFVVLALFPDYHEPEPLCAGPANAPEPPMLKFIKGLEHGVWGSICADDFVPFFVEATDVVHEVCESFIPQ